MSLRSENTLMIFTIIWIAAVKCYHTGNNSDTDLVFNKLKL